MRMGIGKKIAGGFLILWGIAGLVFGVPNILYDVGVYGLNPSTIGGLISVFVIAPLLIYAGVKLVRSK